MAADGGGDLTLKAVLETVLNAQGFDDFKSNLENAANQAKRSGAGAEEAGGHFDKLGRRLPHAAFDILSREMLRNVGVQEGLGPLTRVSTTALESLAAAGQLTGSALAGATLGLSLLLPLIATLASKSGEAAAATAKVEDDANSLIATYEELRAKTGHLTVSQSAYLAVLKEIQREEFARAEQSIQKEIEAQEKLIVSTDTLFGKMKLLAQGIIAVHGRGDAWAAGQKKGKEEVEKARTEVERLTSKLTALEEAHRNGAASAEEFARKIEAESDRAKQLGATLNESWAKQFDQFQKDQARAVELETQRNKKALLEKQADIAAGLELNRTEAEKVARDYAAASERANAAILRDDSQFGNTMAVRRNARRKQFESELDDQVQTFHHAKLSDARIAQFVEAEKARFAKEEAATEKEIALQRAQNYITGAQMAMGALTSIFGESKATQYAQAVINTAEGITQALATPPPLSFVLAAMVGAAGAAQIAKIRSTSRGAAAGFDDPVNDLLARDYGRRWAADFTREVGTGFSRGLGESRAASSVVHQSTRIDRGINIGTANFNGLMGSPAQAMLDFERKRIRVARVENRTRRRSTS